MWKRLTIALAVFAFLAVLLGAYVAGYFWLGRYDRLPILRPSGPPAANIRFYPTKFWAAMFRPAARVETRITGQPTYAVDRDTEEIID